jgi:hypothetical protein
MKMRAKLFGWVAYNLMFVNIGFFVVFLICVLTDTFWPFLAYTVGVICSDADHYWWTKQRKRERDNESDI